jgi:hypothetical protein
MHRRILGERRPPRTDSRPAATGVQSAFLEGDLLRFATHKERILLYMDVVKSHAMSATDSIT